MTMQIRRLSALLDAKQHELLRLLMASGTDVHIVGGTVRDYVLGAGQHPADLDLMVPNSQYETAVSLLAKNEVVTCNRFGNTRVRSGHGRHIDLYCPGRFYPSVDLPIEAISFADNTAGAIAIRLRTDELLDPLGGSAMLRRKQVSLNPARWMIESELERSVILIRLGRLLKRRHLQFVDRSGIFNAHQALTQLRRDWLHLGVSGTADDIVDAIQSCATNRDTDPR